MSKSKVPKIRFEGFSGKWEERKFYQVFKNISNNTLSRAELNYSYGKAKNIHYGDVLIKFGELLDIQKEEVPFITNDDFISKFKSSKLFNGDLIIADAAEDNIVGKCCEIINIKDTTIFSGLHTIAVRPIHNFASKYLGYYINSSSYHNQLLPFLQGTKVLSISKTVIQDTDISFPKDALEQTKIGNYFQNLDKLISQKEKKQKTVKQLKKAMLGKMFPKSGKTKPEIRFEGFCGEWIKKELGEIAKITMGQSPNGINYTDNPKDYILVQGNADMKNGFVVPRIWTKEVTKTADIGDLIFSVRAPVGEIGKTKYDIVIGRGVASIKGNEFIFQSLKKMNENGYWKKLSAGSTFDSINSIDLRKAILSITVLDEQTKIGNYFQKLDKLIELQEKELEKLKNLKKASLDKMFVS